MDLSCFLRVASFHWFLAEGKTACGSIEQCRRNQRPYRDSSSSTSLPAAGAVPQVLGLRADQLRTLDGTCGGNQIQAVRCPTVSNVSDAGDTPGERRSRSGAAGCSVDGAT